MLPISRAGNNGAAALGRGNGLVCGEEGEERRGWVSASEEGGKGGISPIFLMVNSSMAGVGSGRGCARSPGRAVASAPELRQSLQHLPLERIGFETVPPGENWV